MKASALNILSSAITNTLSFELSWHRAFRKNYKLIINIHGCVLYKYLEYSIFCKYLNISPQHDNSIFDTCHLSFQNQYHSLCNNLCQIVQISFRKSRNLRYILCLFLCLPTTWCISSSSQHDQLMKNLNNNNIRADANISTWLRWLQSSYKTYILLVYSETFVDITFLLTM